VPNILDFGLVSLFVIIKYPSNSLPSHVFDVNLLNFTDEHVVCLFVLNY